MFPFPNRESEESRMIRHQESMNREQMALSGIENINDQLAQNRIDMRQDLLKWQQDLEDEKEKLKHELKNEEWDYENKSWVKKKTVKRDTRGNPVRNQEGKFVWTTQKPMLNDLGISTIMRLVGPLFSRNLINSNLSEDYVLQKLRRTCNDLATDLVLHYQIYEVDPANFPQLTRLVKNYIDAAPFRAIGGWNKRTDSTISKRMEAITETGNREQNKGFFWKMRGG